jgi:hypothetical protein
MILAARPNVNALCEAFRPHALDGKQPRRYPESSNLVYALKKSEDGWSSPETQATEDAGDNWAEGIFERFSRGHEKFAAGTAEASDA